MTADEPPPSLEDLDRRLREARGTQERPGAAPSRTRSIGQALRLATEMASALFVGVVIGWGLDELLGTRPWMMLLFLVLGMAAGTLNAYRTAKRLSAATDKDDETSGDRGA